MRFLCVLLVAGAAACAVRVSPAALRMAAAASAPPPWWLCRPECGDAERLAERVPFLLPPRKVQDTEFSECGRAVPGRCLPYALLMQLQQRGIKERQTCDVKSIDALRDEVLDFAVANQGERWSKDEPEFDELGKVIATVAANRGWVVGGVGGGGGGSGQNGGGLLRDLRTRGAVAAWAARTRRTPVEGCDAAFLFVAAACYGLRVHVHYLAPSGRMVERSFAVPSSAGEPLRRRGSPRPTDVHVGYTDNGDGTNHYVSLPPIWAAGV